MSIQVLEANSFMDTGKVSEMSAQIGQKAPDFTMDMYVDDLVVLTSDLKMME